MDSPLCFPWDEMKKQLDSDPSDWTLQHYRNRSGEYISTTLGAHAERLKAGTNSPAHRDTCAYIYHAHMGSGKSDITAANGEKTTVVWQANDTFAVPAWSQIVHHADGSEDAYLFVLSDRPLLERLNMYSEERL